MNTEHTCWWCKEKTEKPKWAKIGKGIPLCETCFTMGRQLLLLLGRGRNILAKDKGIFIGIPNNKG